VTADDPYAAIGGAGTLHSHSKWWNDIAVTKSNVFGNDVGVGNTALWDVSAMETRVKRVSSASSTGSRSSRMSRLSRTPQRRAIR
jgi:hypothetical protein